MVHFFDADIAKKNGVNAAVLAASFGIVLSRKAPNRRSSMRARFGYAVRCR